MGWKNIFAVVTIFLCISSNFLKIFFKEGQHVFSVIFYRTHSFFSTLFFYDIEIYIPGDFYRPCRVEWKDNNNFRRNFTDKN